MIRVLFGIVLGVLLLMAGAWLWLTYGHPPVAVADAALPFERFITGVPLHARVDRDVTHCATWPVQADEATFVAGARIYREQCAFCHGLSGSASHVGEHMFPDAPPLWEKHHDGEVVGVSDDPPVETYWKVANGIRLTGMPAYKQVAFGDRDVAGERAAGQCRQAAAAGRGDAAEAAAGLRFRFTELRADTGRAPKAAGR